MRFPEGGPVSSIVDGITSMPLADHVRFHHLKFVGGGEPIRNGFGGGGVAGDLLVMAYQPNQPGHERVVGIPHTQGNIEAVINHELAENGTGDITGTDAALPGALSEHQDNG